MRTGACFSSSAVIATLSEGRSTHSWAPFVGSLAGQDSACTWLPLMLSCHAGWGKSSSPARAGWPSGQSLSFAAARAAVHRRQQEPGAPLGGGGRARGRRGRRRRRYGRSTVRSRRRSTRSRAAPRCLPAAGSTRPPPSAPASASVAPPTLPPIPTSAAAITAAIAPRAPTFRACDPDVTMAQPPSFVSALPLPPPVLVPALPLPLPSPLAPDALDELPPAAARPRRRCCAVAARAGARRRRG